MTNVQITRRGVLTAALAGLTVPLGFTGKAAPAQPAGPLQFVLPGPTGPFPVGTVALHLVDRSRPDPVAGPGHHRELMASIWYPARDVARHPRAPWLGDAALRALLAGNGYPQDVALAPVTAGRVGAPVRRTGGRLPVVLYSHGAHDHRGDHTIMVQELASHGYLVVTVGHTYDTYAEFPDGRFEIPLDSDEHALGARDFAEDFPFVLDTVEALAAGRNPDAGGKALPVGLRGAPDLRRVGMFGSSKGGTATALLMEADGRVRAGLSLDAPFEPYVETDLDRPFMIVTADHTRDQEPVAGLWSHLTGWRRTIMVDGGAHSTLGDYKVLGTQLATVTGMSDEDLHGWVGAVPVSRAVRIQQAYPVAFFDLHLRHRRQRLLEGPSAAFPEVRFIP